MLLHFATQKDRLFAEVISGTGRLAPSDLVYLISRQALGLIRVNSCHLIGSWPDFKCSSGDGLSAEARLHDPDEFFLAGLGRGGIEYDLARVQKVNAVAHFEYLVIVVDDQNNRDAALASQILDETQNVSALPHAQGS